MNKNEYSQYAFKKLTTQDMYVTRHISKKQFNIDGGSLPSNGIYAFPFEN